MDSTEQLIVQDEVLRDLPLHELYSRLFLHFGASYPHVLLLIAVVQACRHRRKHINDRVLRALRAEGQGQKCAMLLYMLGHAWQAMGAGMDARAIVVKRIVSAWAERKCAWFRHTACA